MLDRILDINEACLCLKDGFILKDSFNTYFKLKNKKILIKGDNHTCYLDLKEFKILYKNSKFIIVEDDYTLIDSKKDEEYYSFKHK